MASGMPMSTWKNVINNAYTGWSGLNAVATHKIALANSTYTFNADTEHGWSATNEVSGTGWASGGIALSAAASGGGSTSPVLSSTSGVITYSMGNVSVSGTTLSAAAYARLYADAVTSPTADPVFVVVDFGGTFTTSAGVFGITWAGSGVFTMDL